jgi:hypothetical protein
MALLRMAGAKAWERLSASETELGDGWWNRQLPDNRIGANAMVRRFAAGVVIPDVCRPATLAGDRRVFAVGSCFARRIEGALMRAGVPCLSSCDAVKAEGCDLFGSGWDFWNKYNTYSILNELRWALDPRGAFPESALVEIGPASYWDYHAHIGRYRELGAEPARADMPALLAFHRSLTRLFERIREAHAVIITLGLNEVWLDEDTGLYLNDPPSQSAVRRHPGRFVFEIPSAEDNLRNLEEIHTIIRVHCPNVESLFVTVSPVPLGATFSGEDVLVANTLSKSTLRYVATAWASLHQEIVYFPAYEMAMNSRRDLVWEADQIHVSETFAGRIVDHFLSCCSPSDVAQPRKPGRANAERASLV